MPLSSQTPQQKFKSADEARLAFMNNYLLGGSQQARDRVTSGQEAPPAPVAVGRDGKVVTWSPQTGSATHDTPPAGVTIDPNLTPYWSDKPLADLQLSWTPKTTTGGAGSAGGGLLDNAAGGALSGTGGAGGGTTGTGGASGSYPSGSAGWGGTGGSGGGASGTGGVGGGVGGTVVPGGIAQAQTHLATAHTVDPRRVGNAGDAALANTTTVQGLLANIMQQDNPLMRMASTNAQQGMAARGLLNSSMAIGEGQKALYSVAMPIAQQDAQAHNQASQFNAGAKNQMAQFNAGNQMQAGLANMQAQNAQSQFNTQQQNAQSQFNASQTNDILKTQLEHENRAALANIEASYKTLMQANQSAGELYQQTIKNIADLASNKDMSADTKTTMINNQLVFLRAGMGMFEKMNGIEGLADLLTFTGPNGIADVPAEPPKDTGNNNNKSGGTSSSTGSTGTSGATTPSPQGPHFSNEPSN